MGIVCRRQEGGCCAAASTWVVSERFEEDQNKLISLEDVLKVLCIVRIAILGKPGAANGELVKA